MRGGATWALASTMRSGEYLSKSLKSASRRLSGTVVPSNVFGIASKTKTSCSSTGQSGLSIFSTRNLPILPKPMTPIRRGIPRFGATRGTRGVRSLFKIDFVYDCSAEIIRFITEFFLSFVHVAISMPDVELGIQNPSAASVPQAQQHHVAPKRSVMVQAPFPNQLEFRFSVLWGDGIVAYMLVPRRPQKRWR